MATFVDLHCHPTLKHHLFDTPIDDDRDPPRDPTVVRQHLLYASLPKMRRGNVGVALAAHHLPEHALIDQAQIAPGLRELIMLLLGSKLERFEQTKSPEAGFRQAQAMVLRFKQHAQDLGAACPKNHAEVDAAEKGGRIVLLQALEGAHHLGRGLASAQDYLTHLDWFLNQGVCSLTLAHFFPNDCVSPVNGMPPGIIDTLGYPTTFPDTGLSAVGDEVVRWMLDQGMIVDLTHSSPRARRRIYEINDARGPGRRPLIFSHAGAATVFARHAAPENLRDSQMSPSDEELRRLQACGGVIGVILMNYWLCGREEANRWFGQPDRTLPLVVETVKHVGEVLGTYENVAIGTDYDGFTDVPDDAPNIAALGKVADALAAGGVSSADVDRVLGGNARRVLRAGWR